MTKKDYIIIAASLKDSLEAIKRNSDDSQADTMLMKTGALLTIRELAYSLKADNSRFNIDKFLKACGYSAE